MDQINVVEHAYPCECGLATFYLNPNDITGMSSLRRSMFIRKIRKDAERNGGNFVEHKIKNCPRCHREIDWDNIAGVEKIDLSKE